MTLATDASQHARELSLALALPSIHRETIVEAGDALVRLAELAEGVGPVAAELRGLADGIRESHLAPMLRALADKLDP